MTTTKIPIGWETTSREYRIKQGAQGSIQIRLSVRTDDGLPLPSYQGFSAKFALHSSIGKLIQEFTQANNTVVVFGDDLTFEVVVEILFRSEDTIKYPPNTTLLGDLRVTLPNGTEHQYPYEMKLHTLRSYAT